MAEDQELDKEDAFKLSKLNIKLPKFNGHDSVMDFFTFKSTFNKLHSRDVPTRMMPDLIKNNYLDGSALLRVKDLDEIEEIWTRLKDAFGDPKTMLNRKLEEVKNINITNLLLYYQFCYQCLLPGADARKGRHADGMCQRDFVCKHENHNRYKRKMHVLLCEQHKDLPANQELLEQYKKRCILKETTIELPSFSKDIKLAFPTYGPKTTVGSSMVVEKEIKENAIYQLDGVVECAVIGIPDEQWGETVHAIVRKQSESKISEEDVIAHSKSLIAGFKCPKSVSFRDDPMPLSGAGKILKTKLREPFWKGHAKQVS